MNTTSANLDSIPLNRLVPWGGNVRKTGASDGLDGLAASIAAHGVLQSLVVRKAQRGKYAIVAGRRRFLALSALAEAGTIEADAPVPCRVLPGSSASQPDDQALDALMKRVLSLNVELTKLERNIPVAQREGAPRRIRELILGASMGRRHPGRRPGGKHPDTAAADDVCAHLRA